MNVLENQFRERSLMKLLRWTTRHFLAALVFAYVGEMTFYGVAEPFWMDELAVVFGVLAIGGVPFTLPLPSLIEKGRNDRVRVAAAKALANRGQIEAVGPIAGCLFDSRLEVRQACAEALHQLLPRVTDEHYGTLGADSISNWAGC